MKFDILKLSAGFIIVFALSMCSSIATETTWRHPGFEVWEYDINFSDTYNLTNVLNYDGHDADITNITADNITSRQIGGVIYADQYDTIQDAIDASNHNSIVFVPYGEYIITEPIILKGETKFMSNGAIIKTEGTQAIWNQQRGMVETPLDGAAVDISISGFEFDVNGSTVAITSYGHKRISIYDNKFKNGTDYTFGGIIFFNGQSASFDMNNTYIYQNTFINTSVYAIHMYPRNGHEVHNLNIYNNYFENITSVAVYLDAYSTCKNINIYQNTFINIVDGGNALAATAVHAGLAQAYEIYDLSIVNNYYSNSLPNQESGFVYFYALNNTLIDGNTAICTGNHSLDHGPAFAPGRVDWPVSGCIISNNYISGFDAAFDFDSANDIIIENNIFENLGFILGPHGEHKNNIFRNNLIKNTNRTEHYGDYPSYNESAIILETPTNMMIIENNVFIDDTDSPQQKYAFGTPTLIMIDNYTIRNNLLKGGTTALLQPDGAGITWGYNIIVEGNRYENTTGLRLNRVNTIDVPFNYGNRASEPLLYDAGDEYCDTTTNVCYKASSSTVWNALW